MGICYTYRIKFHEPSPSDGAFSSAEYIVYLFDRKINQVSPLFIMSIGNFSSSSS